VNYALTPKRCAIGGDGIFPCRYIAHAARAILSAISDAHSQLGSETYGVRPGIVASVRYGKSGHVCEVLVRPAKPFYPIQSRLSAISSGSLEPLAK
jgi:hypothetical protein